MINKRLMGKEIDWPALRQSKFHLVTVMEERRILPQEKEGLQWIFDFFDQLQTDYEPVGEKRAKRKLKRRNK